MKNAFKLLFAVALLAVAFLFTFIFPGSAWESTVIPVVTSIASVFGFKNWREHYGVVKDWFKSKTVWGAVVASIPILVLAALSAAGVTLPAWVNSLLTAILSLGGGTTLVGIFDAFFKNKNGDK